MRINFVNGNEAMSGCPAQKILERFLAGALGGRAEEDLCSHVEDCCRCQRQLDGLVARSLPKPWPAERAGARDPELDPAFLTRLRQTLAVSDWRAPRWTEAHWHVDSSGESGEAPPSPVQDLVPGYEILGELGRGAMGVVYKARQLGLGRVTALKMILAGEHAGLNERTRFRAEAEAAGSLRHPHIVQIYESGESGGRLFFSMEYVEGQTLKEWLGGAPQPAAAAAVLVETLARAVDYAHRRGIVHRDLKPANVLLEAAVALPPGKSGARSNEPAMELARLGLVPKIADFGLAKRVGETLGTQTGQLMGTPSYMSPEHLTGQGAATGPGVDIYALGCMLYEALTGRPPFLDASIEALAMRVRHEEPVPPRRLQPRCPRDLETICLKCLEKEPGRRYRTALLLADDLRRFLRREPIQARAPSIVNRWLKFTRRNRVAVSSVAAVIVALAAGVAATTEVARRESLARRLADQSVLRALKSARQAEDARVAVLREAYQARLSAALAALGHHDIREATRQLDSVPTELRGWEWRHLHGRLDQSLATVARLSLDTAIALCPPGQGIGVPDGHGIRVLDAISGTTLTAFTTDRPCRGVYAFRSGAALRFVLDQSTSKSLSMSVTDERGIKLGPNAESRPSEDGCATAVALSPDGRRLALHSVSRFRAPLIEVFDTATGRLTATCGESLLNRLLGLDFSPDGTFLAAARSEDKEVLVFDAVTGRRVTAFRGHDAMVRGVAYSPDGRRLAACGEDQTIRVWDTATGDMLCTLRGHSGGVQCVAFSPDGRRLVSGGSDSTVRIWNAQGGNAALVLEGHTAAVTRVAFSGDGRTIASAASDGTARVWDALALDDPCVLRGHANYVYPVAYSPDGRTIASGSWDSTVRLWDAAGGSPARILEGHAKPVGALKFTPLGERLVSWGEEGVIRIWDTATGAQQGTVPHHGMGYRDSVYSLVVTHDGRRVGAVTTGGIRFWDLETRAVHATLRLPIERVRVVAMSPDGTRVAAGGDESRVVIVDAGSGVTVAQLTGFAGRIQSVAFSPDGRHVLTAGMDPVLRLWDAASGRLVRKFAGHSLEVLAAVFHPDGSRIASGGHDRSILIWDAATGERLVRLPGHSSYIFSLAFSPDGQTLVSGSGDATVRLWDTFPVARRLQALHRATRTLRAGKGTLRGGDEPGREPGTAPPHTPSQGTPRHVDHAQLTEVRPVSAGGEDIRDQEPSAWAQHTHSLRDRSIAAGPSLDVVDRNAGKHYVEALVLEGQGGHVGGVNVHAVGNPER
jgi:WD40 repeat protein/serine/threonine protein kinase